MGMSSVRPRRDYHWRRGLVSDLLCGWLECVTDSDPEREDTRLDWGCVLSECVWRVEGGREWIEGRGGVVARMVLGNAVDGTPSGCRGLQPPPPLGAGEGNEEVVCWSGWVGDARVEEGWFERSVGAWMPQGVAQREEVVGRLVDAGVVIRAHTRHLVSDVPACLNLLREKPGVKLLVDVAGFFEPSMIGDASVHLERILGGLGGAAWGVVLSDVAVVGRGDEQWCVPVASGAGVLDMERLRGLVGECCGDGVRIIERG
jgi:hypothetical protein